MSFQRPRVTAQPIQAEQVSAWPPFTNSLLRRIIGRLANGRLLIDTPAGDRFVFESGRLGPQARLIIHRWRCLWRLLTGWDIGFAESYMAGEWSSPDIVRLLELACQNSEIATLAPVLGARRLLLKFRHDLNRNTRRGSRRNIAAHYDLGNDFYSRWLDPGMTYSSALYSSPCRTLEEAQRAKLDRVTDLLAMSGREKVLEIGCGWGSLAEQMIDQHDCTVTGLTNHVASLYRDHGSRSLGHSPGQRSAAP
jgi:cyclopropane-fatty-acyl-phospholipid synthase